VIGFLVTGALGMPIGFALALVSLTYLVSLGRVPLTILPIKIIGGVDSFPLLAIPLFILGGALMETGGISQRIVDFAKAMVGHLRGACRWGRSWRKCCLRHLRLHHGGRVRDGLPDGALDETGRLSG